MNLWRWTKFCKIRRTSSSWILVKCSTVLELHPKITFKFLKLAWKCWKFKYFWSCGSVESRIILAVGTNINFNSCTADQIDLLPLIVSFYIPFRCLSYCRNDNNCWIFNSNCWSDLSSPWVSTEACTSMAPSPLQSMLV